MFENIEILKVVNGLGYRTFTTGYYNVNIIGVRNNISTPNVFDDELHIIYKDYNNTVVHKIYKITTDPGTYWLENPMKVEGTAILKPNQYPGTYEIDLHRGQYQALCQRKPVEVYRDSDRDNNFDFDESTVERGYFGINIHRSNSSSESTQVNKWSAGCQVFANPKAYEEFMEIVTKSSGVYGNSFTYTLINKKDIEDYRLR